MNLNNKGRARMMVKMFAVAGYVVAIVVANVVTANYLPLQFDALGQHWVVTWGTFLIGVTFFARDAVQMAVGRAGAYVAIVGALLVNVALSRHYGDLAWITAGSAVSFAVSETLDTEVYSRLRSSYGTRIAVSGVAGGTLDSLIFATLALSPLTTGIVPWAYLWTTIVAQVVIKCALNAIVGLNVRRLELALA
jgi:uncharacterized PurR-regulated membrane protein YhhQ (DUF165 family)